MPNLSECTPCDTEIRLIKAISEQPSSRALYVELAEFLEENHFLEESRTVYRGILPQILQSRHELDPYPHSKSDDMDSCMRLGLYGNEQFCMTAPINADPLRNSIFLPLHRRTGWEHVDIMHNGILCYDGQNRLYVDSEYCRNSDHSTMNSYLLMPRATKSRPERHLSGISILLAARNSHNFYHWHYDCLAALGLVEAAGIALSDIDNFLVDNRNMGFQLQMLLSAGICQSRIQFIDVDEFTASYDYMLMVRLQNQQGMAQSRRHLDWLRRTYLDTAKLFTDSAPSSASRIAIKRDIRGFTDAESIYEKLADSGYECIRLEDYPYSEQVAIFAGADNIVAPHGAGLSLLVYCKPGTVVHEFYADHVQPCFWSISSALGLKYHNYNCSSIVDGAVTESNKNLAQRLAKTIDLTPDYLDTLSL